MIHLLSSFTYRTASLAILYGTECFIAISEKTVFLPSEHGPARNGLQICHFFSKKIMSSAQALKLCMQNTFLKALKNKTLNVFIFCVCASFCKEVMFPFSQLMLYCLNREATIQSIMQCVKTSLFYFYFGFHFYHCYIVTLEYKKCILLQYKPYHSCS